MHSIAEFHEWINMERFLENQKPYFSNPGRPYWNNFSTIPSWRAKHSEENDGSPRFLRPSIKKLQASQKAKKDETYQKNG